MNKKETMERVIEAARATYNNEGFIEIDDNAMASVGEPPDDGVYVQAWVWVSLSDMDGVTEDDLKQLNSMHRFKRCPHGNKLGDCDACDVAGDLAYDADREDRYFNRR